MNKRLISIIVILVVIVTAGTWYFFLRERNSTDRYKTAKVEKGDIEERVAATGRIEALVTVSVGSQVSGTIKELLADYNSIVKKGQVVAFLEPSIFMAQKKQAEANLASATSNLEKSEVALEEAKRNLKRGEDLYIEKLISDSEIDALRSAYESAVAQLSVSRSQVKQAEASLSLAEVNLGHTVITSPIDGIVISRNVDAGQTVAASLQAPTLFTIANDLTKMQVHSDISESDVGKIKEGQDVSFRVDAFPKEQFHGKVSQVRNAGVIVQNVVTYDAVINVDNKDLKLKPGMTAYVSILVDRRENVLKIPNLSLRFKPSNMPEDGKLKFNSKGASGHPSISDMPVIWILKDGKPIPIGVKTAITDGKFSEVMEGDLSEGDDVILEELFVNKQKERKMPMMGRGF
ncbi:MAG: efflux RND transporter periplasmic adaptor subunit [Acidobacteriota bacterium]